MLEECPVWRPIIVAGKNWVGLSWVVPGSWVFMIKEPGALSEASTSHRKARGARA